MEIVLNDSWNLILQEELNKPYIQDLKNFIGFEGQGHVIYPPESEFFEALNQTTFEGTKVIILGQDPYHQAGQANGMAFSVNKGIRIPPSLRNIYKELEQDCPVFNIPSHGDLSSWANQGVLLLNTTLSVRDNKAGSHQKRGWEKLTDAIISKLSKHRTGLVFILWGNSAQGKVPLIDQTKHHIICSAHPSPLSAYRGFIGSKPFSKTNNLLIQEGKEPINWNIPEERH